MINHSVISVRLISLSLWHETLKTPKTVRHPFDALCHVTVSVALKEKDATDGFFDVRALYNEISETYHWKICAGSTHFNHTYIESKTIFKE